MICYFQFLFLPAFTLLQHPPVVPGHDLFKSRQRLVPVLQYGPGWSAAGVPQMVFNHGAERGYILRVGNQFQVRQARVKLDLKVVVWVVDKRNATAHARCKISSRRSQDYRYSTGHVFTAVITDPFYHGTSAAIADAEPFPGAPPNEGLPGGGAVQRHVADDNV